MTSADVRKSARGAPSTEFRRIHQLGGAAQAPGPLGFRKSVWILFAARNAKKNRAAGDAPIALRDLLLTPGSPGGMRILAGRGWWRGRALAAWVTGAPGRALPWAPGARTGGAAGHSRALDRPCSSAARKVTAASVLASSVWETGRELPEGLEAGRTS